METSNRFSWNCYRRVEEYNQWKRERYWGDWEWRQACQSEAEAKAIIAQWEKWNQENNARTDGALIPTGRCGTGGLLLIPQ